VREFLSVQDKRQQAYTRIKAVALKDEFDEKMDSLLNEIFCDRDCVEPDEPGPWQSYVEGIREPLQSLFDLGFAFFLLDEKGDLLLPDIPGQPRPSAGHIENWRIRHYLLVSRHGCFQTGVFGALHRFNEACPAAGDALFNAVKKRGEAVHAFRNAVYAVANAGGEDVVRWCETCFPPDSDWHTHRS
jgi:hypothetical protein